MPREDQAVQVWLSEDYGAKADRIAALLTLRMTERVTRVQAVRWALDELLDHLEENTTAPH